MRLVDWSVVDSPSVSRCRPVSPEAGRYDIGHRPRGADGETTTGPQEGRKKEKEEETRERMRSIRRDLRRWFRETGTAVRDA